jgi:hypothetical protein
VATTARSTNFLLQFNGIDIICHFDQRLVYAMKKQVPRLWNHSRANDSAVFGMTECEGNSLHEPATVFAGGSTHRQAIQLGGRHTNTNRHGLPVFAAGANAFVELQIVADHRNSS